ncbi:MAG: hypothetical protein JNK82_10485 [Myxococcaceae bacterium]|nr:hypothetical protein [Myxococcaceae bacterium]
MPRRRAGATLGVSDHWGWAVLVTLDADGSVLDSRRVELLEPGLNKHPHHHPDPKLSVREQVAEVARVARSIRAEAAKRFDELDLPIACIALRANPKLPKTVEERMTDYVAHNVADSVLYREALAAAARARGWAVHTFDARAALTAAGKKAKGTKDEKLAMAGALSATPAS